MTKKSIRHDYFRFCHAERSEASTLDSSLRSEWHRLSCWTERKRSEASILDSSLRSEWQKRALGMTKKSTWNDTTLSCWTERKRSEASTLDSSLRSEWHRACHAEQSVSEVKHPYWIPRSRSEWQKRALGMTKKEHLEWQKKALGMTKKCTAHLCSGIWKRQSWKNAANLHVHLVNMTEVMPVHDTMPEKSTNLRKSEVWYLSHFV